MARIEYKINLSKEENELFIEITPTLSQQKVVYSIGRNSPEERPVKFFTATTDMKDWIGNVRNVVDNNKERRLSVEGVYRGRQRILSNIKAGDATLKVGDRVMITEHLNVSGNFEMLATKIRLLDHRKSELNFINMGWSTDNVCRYLRVDPYTGETKECIGGAVR